jgi:hypothetical protein
MHLGHTSEVLYNYTAALDARYTRMCTSWSLHSDSLVYMPSVCCVAVQLS